jgi:hypothetical protein
MGTDTKAPEILSYKLSSYKFDLSNGDITIDVAARITDDISGVFDGVLANGIGGSPSQARWRSPSGNQFLDAGIFDSPSSGNFLDGIYTDQTVLTTNAELGTWKLESFFLADEAGNTKSLNTEQLKALGIQTTFEVTNDVLTGAPKNPDNGRPGSGGRGGGPKSGRNPGGRPGRTGRPIRGRLTTEAVDSPTTQRLVEFDEAASTMTKLDGNALTIDAATKADSPNTNASLVSTYQILRESKQFPDEPRNPLAYVEVPFDDSKPLAVKAMITTSGGIVTGIDSTGRDTGLSPFGDQLDIPNTVFNDSVDIRIQEGSPLSQFTVGNNFRSSPFPEGSANSGDDTVRVSGAFWQLDTARIIDGDKIGSNNFYGFDGKDTFAIDAASGNFKLQIINSGFDEERAAGYTVLNLRFVVDNENDFQIYLTGVEFIQFNDGYLNTEELLRGIDVQSLPFGESVWEGSNFGNTKGLIPSQVPDIVSPALVSSLPADNAPSVPVGSNIVLNFSEAIKAGNGNILIKKVSDNSVFTSIPISDTSQVSFNGQTATINPLSDLSFSTQYFVGIEAGAIQDFAGNSFAGITDNISLNFTTIDQMTGMPGRPSPGGRPLPGRRPGPGGGGRPGKRRLTVGAFDSPISQKMFEFEAAPIDLMRAGITQSPESDTGNISVIKSNMSALGETSPTLLTIDEIYP